MLELQVFAPDAGLQNPSPFGAKAVALMQMSGLEYRLVAGDVRKSPKGKMPVLVDGNREIADTAHIQQYLENERGIEFDAGLTDEQLAIAQAFRHLGEDSLYWAITYSRWIENGDIVREALFGAVPALMRNFVFSMVKKQVKAALHGQGLGRHSAGEIYQFGAADLSAIAVFLGDKDFMFGQKPSSIDASLYGMLSNIAIPAFDTPLRDELNSHENLLAYMLRFNKKYQIGGWVLQAADQ